MKAWQSPETITLWGSLARSHNNNKSRALSCQAPGQLRASDVLRKNIFTWAWYIPCVSLHVSTEYKMSGKLATFSVKVLITRSQVLKEFYYVVRTTRTRPASSSSSSSPWWSCSPWLSSCSSWSLSPSPAMTPRRSSSQTWRHKMTSQMTRYNPSI